MKTPTTTNNFSLTVGEIRKLKEQLISASVKPTSHGVFFMVTTKAKVRKVLKALGFTPTEIKETMKRIERIK